MTYSALPRRIETPRLILTPEEPSDAAWLAELFGERGAGPVTVEDAARRIADMTVTFDTLGIGALVLRLRSDGAALGYVAIVVGRASVDEPELAFELLPRAQGRGYATEASAAVLDAAFATGRAHIWATVAPSNAPSLRVLEKLGFGRHHRTTDVDGDVIWLVRDR